MPSLRFLRLQLESLSARFQALGAKAKAGICAYAGFNVVLLFAVWYVGPSTIAEYMARLAVYIREMEYGYLLVVAGLVLCSIPPMIGYGAAITLCGFAFGINGAAIAISGTLLGSAVSFTVCRQFLQIFKYQLDQMEHFVALNKAVRAKGLPLLMLIRLSPFPPFTYSNLFCASIDSVTLPQFLLASFANIPRLILHVWIGDRMYRLADPSERAKMDDTAKWVNGVFIGVASLVGFLTGFYVYRLTLQYVNQIALDDDAALSRLEEAHSDGEDGDGDMTTDELDRQLRMQGIDPSRISISDAGEGWNDNFSDFDENENGRKSLQLDSTRPMDVTEDDLATPRVEKQQPAFR